MSRITPRALALAVVSAVALAMVPGSASAATSKAEKRQNTAIKKSASAAKKAGSTARKAGSTARKAGSTARKADARAAAAAASATKAINDAKTANDEAKKANDGVGVLNTAVVPAALKALTDLRDGLLALKTGLEAAGAGLTRLGAFVQADEYGVVSISVAGTPVGGCFYETANIPDNVQDAIVSGTCNIPANVASAGGSISVNAAIRSNESDGAASGPDAGVAGIVAFTATTATVGGASPVVTGFGATGPNAALGGAPAIGIALKSAPTSTTETSFPFATISTDNLVDLATTANGFAGSPGAATLLPASGAANLRAIEFTVRFNDLTPDANNPTA